MNTLTFKSWKRSQLFATAVRPAGKSRLGATLKLTVTDDADGGTATGNAPFVLMSAADVAGIKPSAILRVAPAPYTRDAETTKYVHIDFAEQDLPWRYTPLPNDAALQPWVALLVGTPAEIQINANCASVTAPVFSEHKLNESHLWAHVQDDTHSRLLSPRKLKPQHEYVAALVPAFNAAGNSAWDDATQNLVLPVFYSWRFWTGEEGDFETLAAKLHAPIAGDVGRAQLHYPRDVVINGVSEKPVFRLSGAIASLQADLGRIQPETMDDGQLLDALRSITPRPEHANLLALSTTEKRALLTQRCKPVRDSIKNTRADLDLLNDTVIDAVEPKRQFLSLPHYGRPWLADPDAATEGWPEALNDDPRYRGTAGLGMWMGVEGQEALMDAAVEQAGALRDAASRVSHLALGVMSASSLWQRRLPENKNLRLRIFGPMMSRLLADDGGTVMSRITSATSPLSPAWFSSASQRLLRDRATHSRHTAGTETSASRLDRGALLDLANQPTPLPDRIAQGVPSMEAIADKLGLAPFEKMLGIDEGVVEKIRRELAAFMQDAANAYEQTQSRTKRQLLAEEVAQKYTQILQDLLANFRLSCEGQQLVNQMSARLNLGLKWQEIIEDALSDEAARERLEAALIRAVRQCMAQQACSELAHRLDRPNANLFCDDLLDNLPEPPQQEQKPIKLDVLHDAVEAAVDPTALDSPARRRVAGTIQGLDISRLTPPQLPIGLNFPTWELLRQYDKEWLLPGTGALKKDSLTALQTNPAFVDAFMVGINTQFMNEMRWRDVAVVRNCTPLRMFWGQMNYAEQKRKPDIEPLDQWAKAPAKDVGDLSHQTIKPADTGNASGSRLVIVIRSDLFRRYPSTLVYLVTRRVIEVGGGKFRPATAADAENTLMPEDDLLKLTPVLEHDEDKRLERIHFGPTFVGTLTPDVTFFCFDVSPDTLDQYWLVLDEPPTELRFRNDQAENKEHSAAFAKSTIDKPTRVAINGQFLEDQARGVNP